MSFFKRLGNLGKGVWHVNTGGRDPEEQARIRALQEELAAQQATRSPRRAASARAASAGAASPAAADPQARLDALAEQLRAGTLTREQYDAACQKIIAQMDGHDPEAAPAEPAADPPSSDDGPIKRTL